MPVAGGGAACQRSRRAGLGLVPGAVVESGASRTSLSLDPATANHPRDGLAPGSRGAAGGGSAPVRLERFEVNRIGGAS
jgi:hypothetical protein